MKYAQQFPEFDAVIGATLGWYFENFTTPEFAKAFGGFPLFPDNEGIYTLNCPQLKVGGGGKIQHVAMADDFGEMVHGLFLDPLKYRNQIVQCLSDAFSFEEMIEVFKEGKSLYTQSCLLCLFAGELIITQCQGNKLVIFLWLPTRTSPPMVIALWKSFSLFFDGFSGRAVYSLVYRMTTGRPNISKMRLAGIRAWTQSRPWLWKSIFLITSETRDSEGPNLIASSLRMRSGPRLKL